MAPRHQVELIHGAVVVRHVGGSEGMRDVPARPIGRLGRDLAHALDRHPRGAIGAGKLAEIGIERMIFLEEDNHMLDGGVPRKRIRVSGRMVRTASDQNDERAGRERE